MAGFVTDASADSFLLLRGLCAESHVLPEVPVVKFQTAALPS